MTEKTLPKPEPLAVELAAFDRAKSDLLRDHKDKFALFKGTDLIGTFSTFALAYEEGIRRYGIEPFLVKRVTSEDEQEHIPALALGLLRART